MPIDENGLVALRARPAGVRAGHRGVAVPVPAAAGERRACARWSSRRCWSRARCSACWSRARRAADAFSSGECEFLRQVSEHVALAAHQAQLYGALQQAYDDLRQTQQQVMQQERLRALGQMASGIAHDINNAISPVALYTEALLERETDLSDRARDRNSRSSSARSTTSRRPWRACASSTASASRSSRSMPVDLNKLVAQVIDLTRARWSDMAQQRGVAIDVRTELDRRSAADRGGRKRDPRRADQSRLQRRGCHAARAARSPSAPASRRAASAQIVLLEVERHGRRHGRGHAPPLPRAVLHHQGRARHRPRPGDGVRRGAAARRRSRDRKRARQGHDGAPELSRSRRRRGRGRERLAAQPAGAACASSSSTTIRCC